MNALLVILILSGVYFFACNNKYEWNIRLILNKHQDENKNKQT